MQLKSKFIIGPAEMLYVATGHRTGKTLVICFKITSSCSYKYFFSSSEQIGFDITSVSGQKFFFNRTMQFWIVIISDDNEGRHKNIYLAKISNDIGEREREKKAIEMGQLRRKAFSQTFSINSSLNMVLIYVITIFQFWDLYLFKGYFLLIILYNIIACLSSLLQGSFASCIRL